MDKSEYRQKQDAAEQKRRKAVEESYRDKVVSSLERIAEQSYATENQASRADTFHRRVESLSLRLESRKFWLEVAETVGLWAAAAVGVIAIIVASHDSGEQTNAILAQVTAVQGQLAEMQASEVATNQIIEINRQLADAASKQAQAAIDSAKTAQANMVASERAWVGPRNARSDIAPEMGKGLNIIVEYQNTGREPALETIADAEAFAAADTVETAAKINGFINQCKMQWIPTKKGVVFPAGPTSSSYELTEPFATDDIDQDVIDGTKFIFIDGCFVYKSAGTIHRTSFCYFFNNKKTKPANWNICGVGNDAD
jgi:hypothetical protein